MANIAITNFCNLKCKYCFADDMIQEKPVSISIDDFRKILDFLARTPKNHVGIIGGEPTLHPHFDQILHEVNIYCKEVNTGATLFTNGIELEPHLSMIGDRIGLLINCNSPEFQSDESFRKQRETLDHLSLLSWFDRKANCGCNLYPGCTNYSYMWDIVDRYHLNHIRTSVVSPAACYQKYRKDKEGYYNLMKPIFLEFVKEAEKHQCRLSMDCGHIPMCYFDQDEVRLLEENCDNLYQDWCEPVVDITADFRATACFGSYDPVDIRDFKTLIDLERYLQFKKSLPKVEKNCTGRCTTCRKYDLMECQGGCLGFADAE